MFKSHRPDQPSLAGARELAWRSQFGETGQSVASFAWQAGQRIEEAYLRARIYQPTRNAMQSGKARTKAWVLEFEPASPRRIDPLMGWTSSSDMLSQVQMEFDSKEEAVAYAQKQKIAYDLFEPHRPTPKPKAYADNFRYDRKVPWSH